MRQRASVGWFAVSGMLCSATLIAGCGGQAPVVPDAAPSSIAASVPSDSAIPDPTAPATVSSAATPDRPPEDTSGRDFSFSSTGGFSLRTVGDFELDSGSSFRLSVDWNGELFSTFVGDSPPNDALVGRYGGDFTATFEKTTVDGRGFPSEQLEDAYIVGLYPEKSRVCKDMESNGIVLNGAMVIKSVEGQECAIEINPVIESFLLGAELRPDGGDVPDGVVTFKGPSSVGWDFGGLDEKEAATWVEAANNPDTLGIAVRHSTPTSGYYCALPDTDGLIWNIYLGPEDNPDAETLAGVVGCE